MTRVGFTRAGCVKFKLAAAVLIAASAAQAEPDLRRVAGVSVDDALNVRAGPGTDNSVVARLANGTLAEILEVSEDGRWGKVAYGEANAWLALRYTEQALRPRVEGMAVGLTCHGTEPFWGAELSNNGRFRFDPMSDTGIAAPIENVEVRQGGHRFTSASTVAELLPMACDNGMADTEYGWRINLTFEGGDLAGSSVTGCCEVRLQTLE